MDIVPRLRDLENNLGELPPDIDAATALIGAVEPETLDESRIQTYKRTGFAALVRRDVRTAEVEFEKTLEQPSSHESKREARIRLEKLLADEAEANEVQLEYSRDLRLARAVDRKRSYLAKPLRWGAAAASAVALSGAGAGLSYMAFTDTNRAANKGLPAEIKPIDESLDGRQILGAALFSGALALVGGVGGYSAVGSKRAKKYAHRRATRMFNEAKRFN
jgi:hypothetical protein